MKKLMLFGGPLFFAAAAYAQEPATVVYPVMPAQYENSIQVNGYAELEVVPDEIYIRIIIDETDTKGKSSVDQLEQEMISRLKNLGIDTDNNLKIGDMKSSFQKQIFRKAAPRTRATYELKVDGAAMLGNVYQTLGEAGISNMSITRLSRSDIEELTDQLRRQAILNARKNAVTLAEALGQKAGRAVMITDYTSGVVPIARRQSEAFYSMDVASVGGAAYETPLDFKEIKLTYNLSAKFVLE